MDHFLRTLSLGIDGNSSFPEVELNFIRCVWDSSLFLLEDTDFVGELIVIKILTSTYTYHREFFIQSYIKGLGNSGPWKQKHDPYPAVLKVIIIKSIQWGTYPHGDAGWRDVQWGEKKWRKTKSRVKPQGRPVVRGWERHKKWSGTKMRAVSRKHWITEDEERGFHQKSVQLSERAKPF